MKTNTRYYTTLNFNILQFMEYEFNFVGEETRYN